MSRNRYYKYNVTYRVYNGWKYNEPNSYTTTTETILARNKKEAFERAQSRADDPGVIAHDPVMVFKKDIKRLPYPPVKKYTVTLYYHTCGEVTVFAKNEEEAEAEAVLECGKNKYDSMFLHNMEEDSSPDIEEDEEDNELDDDIYVL